MLDDLNHDTKRVSCCIMDNEPTANAAADLLPFAWMGCVDHLIELVTGVAFNDTLAVMKSARAVVTAFTGSSQATEMLLQLQKAVNNTAQPLVVVQDVSTRWWSTYAMISRLVQLRDHIHSIYKAGKIAVFLTDEQWSVLIKMTVLLKPFMQLQTFFEGDQYVTLSYVPSMVSFLRTLIDQVFNDIDESDLTDAAKTSLCDTATREINLTVDGALETLALYVRNT